MASASWAGEVVDRVRFGQSKQCEIVFLACMPPADDAGSRCVIATAEASPSLLGNTCSTDKSLRSVARNGRDAVSAEVDSTAFRALERLIDLNRSPADRTVVL